jgi:hypothetical protein
MPYRAAALVGAEFKTEKKKFSYLRLVKAEK